MRLVDVQNIKREFLHKLELFESALAVGSKQVFSSYNSFQFILVVDQDDVTKAHRSENYESIRNNEIELDVLCDKFIGIRANVKKKKKKKNQTMHMIRKLTSIFTTEVFM